MKTKESRFLILMLTLALIPFEQLAAQIITPVPKERRSRIDAERAGFHDANNIRTVFYNFGMVGDFQPAGVDVSVFHSAEIPKRPQLPGNQPHHRSLGQQRRLPDSHRHQDAPATCPRPRCKPRALTRRRSLTYES